MKCSGGRADAARRVALGVIAFCGESDAGRCPPDDRLGSHRQQHDVSCRRGSSHAPLPPGIIGGVPGGAERVSPPRSNRVGHRKPGRARFGRTYRSGGFHAAGCPSMGLKPMGSFEGWSASVRQAVVWAGLPDPAGARRELAQRADQDAIGLARLIEGGQRSTPRSRPDRGRSGQDA